MDPHEHILGGRAAVPENVVYKTFDSETLLLNLDTGTYHGLNPTGGRMLELLRDTGGDVHESVVRLASEYDRPVDQIAAELVAFIGRLEERGLLLVEPR